MSARFERVARRLAPRGWVKTVRRLAAEIHRPSQVRRLRRANENAASPVVGNAPVIVSMTSYGRRIETVYLVVEAIAAGSVRPTRLILWLDDLAVLDDLPVELRRLQGRGLEVRRTEDLGPHKKYYPALEIAERECLPLVTADDDVLYPRRWLEKLLTSVDESKPEVLCHKSHRMRFTDGAIAPYAEWPDNWSSTASPLVFATGVSGVLYPLDLIHALLRHGQGFLDCAPRADDVWLHCVAALSGIPVRQVSSIPTHFAPLERSGSSGLWIENVTHGGNDSQIRATYPADVVDQLSRASNEPLNPRRAERT